MGAWPGLEGAGEGGEQLGRGRGGGGRGWGRAGVFQAEKKEHMAAPT